MASPGTGGGRYLLAVTGTPTRGLPSPHTLCSYSKEGDFLFITHVTPFLSLSYLVCASLTSAAWLLSCLNHNHVLRAENMAWCLVDAQ